MKYSYSMVSQHTPINTGVAGYQHTTQVLKSTPIGAYSSSPYSSRPMPEPPPSYSYPVYPTHPTYGSVQPNSQKETPWMNEVHNRAEQVENADWLQPCFCLCMACACFCACFICFACFTIFVYLFIAEFVEFVQLFIPY